MITLAQVRRAGVALAVVLLTGVHVLVPKAAQSAPPEAVVRTSAGEFQPAKESRYMAWERNTSQRPSHYDVYARIGRGRPFKVNSAGTGAANGGISAGRLVYQQFTRGRSDLKLYNLAARRRSNPRRGVNTAAWEYWPSMSGKWLLFGRLKPNTNARRIVLYNLATGASRKLASTKSKRLFLAPGQVSGKFAVWAKCSPKGCNVFRYNSETKSTSKVPNPGASQHAPSVTPGGIVYFARASSRRCGSHVRLMRFRPGKGSTRVTRLRSGVDTGDTYVYTDPFGNSEVLYDRFKCGKRTASDLFSVAFPRMVKLSASVEGAGRITSSPAGINCPGTCSKQLRAGTKVTLEAQPSTGAGTFVGWGGACSGTGPCTVTLDASKSVTARFETRFDLSVDKQGTGGGMVDSQPAGISCGPECSHSFPAGTEVVLRANADPGSVFVRWEGACNGASPSCAVTIDGSQSVVAVFDLVPTFPLDVSDPGAGGSVTSSPGGIDCPGDCSQSYDQGTSVTLRATPGADFTFGGWGESCSGTTGPTCDVTMNGARSVSARFDPVAPPP
jgi:Fe-S cluster biogenesis protein NfuA